MFKHLTSTLFITLSVFLSLTSCSKDGKVDATKNGTDKPKFVNPFPAGTYENFTAEPSYPKTYNIYKNQELYAKTNASNSSLILDLGKQRGKLFNGDTVVMDYPISSGRDGHETPRGKFAILEKLVDKSSTRYGKVYDANGDVVYSDGDSTKHTIPEGGKFVGAPMKYWMRLTWDGVGHHIGTVPRYPASHGCIRGYYKAVPDVYSKVGIGTHVAIQ
jgi:lipoprotein-anchoring transpeptidase ErfK/SrfK